VAFAFRAAAALEVRRRQEEVARRALASAEAAVDEATAQLREAVSAVAAESDRLVSIRQAGTEAWRIEWHQAWIERQRRVVVARTGAVTERRERAAAAARVAVDAAKRRKVLERLRDRALRRHQRAEQEQHIREMNDLATLRFVAQATSEGGTRAD
jgi:flagellar export protein FliJ